MKDFMAGFLSDLLRSDLVVLISYLRREYKLCVDTGTTFPTVAIRNVLMGLCGTLDIKPKK